MNSIENLKPHRAELGYPERCHTEESFNIMYPQCWASLRIPRLKIGAYAQPLDADNW